MYNEIIWFNILDSFIFSVSYNLDKVPEANFWRDYAKMAEVLDTSGYSSSHIFFRANEDRREHLLALQAANKKKLGCYKDEIDEKYVVSEITALRPKMYSIKLFCPETQQYEKKQTAKGIPKHVVNNSFQPQTYKDCLRTNEGNVVTSSQLRNERHQIYLKKMTKLGLSSFQDKCFALNMVETVPYGHYKIPEYLKMMQSHDLNAQIQAIDADHVPDLLNHYVYLCWNLC